MADDVNKLAVLIEANTKSYENAMKKVVASTNAAMGKAGVSTKRMDSQLSRLNRTSATVASGFGRMAAGLAAGLSVAAVVKFSDSYTRVQNSLKIAGLEGKALTEVYDRLMVSAQNNAAPIGALADLYGKVSLAQKELGISSEQLATFTDTIAVALRVSGKSAAESAGALLQLSQALGGGVVRAEEFNSIMEGAPTIALAAAAGIKEAGGSVAKLRALMIDGKISSKAFFDGIQAGAPVLQALADKTEMTVAQSFTVLNNALVDSVGKFGDATGASDALAASIQAVADTIAGIDWNKLLSGYSAYADQAYKIGQQIRNAVVEQFGGEGDYSNLNPNGIGLAPYKPKQTMTGGRKTGNWDNKSTAVKTISLADYSVPGSSTGSKSGTSAAANKAESDARKRDAEAISLHYNLATEAIDKFNDAQDAAKQKQQDLADGFAQFASDFVNDMQNGATALEAFSNMLEKIAGQLLEAGIQSLASSLFTGGAGGTGIFGSLTGKAVGGPVSANRPYMVGEQGPELFVPSTAGGIVPNGKMGGGGSTFNIDARGAQAGVADQIRKALADYDRGAYSRHVANTFQGRKRGDIR